MLRALSLREWLLGQRFMKQPESALNCLWRRFMELETMVPNLYLQAVALARCTIVEYINETAMCKHTASTQ
jgi:hypothetical protein